MDACLLGKFSCSSAPHLFRRDCVLPAIPRTVLDVSRLVWVLARVRLQAEAASHGVAPTSADFCWHAPSMSLALECGVHADSLTSHQQLQQGNVASIDTGAPRAPRLWHGNKHLQQLAVALGAEVHVAILPWPGEWQPQQALQQHSALCDQAHKEATLLARDVEAYIVCSKACQNGICFRTGASLPIATSGTQCLQECAILLTARCSLCIISC